MTSCLINGQGLDDAFLLFFFIFYCDEFILSSRIVFIVISIFIIKESTINISEPLSQLFTETQK